MSEQNQPANTNSENKNPDSNNPANPQTQADQNQNQQPQQPPPRGGLSIFKLVLYYWIINQVIGFFFKGNNTSNSKVPIYSNVFMNDDPFVNEFKIFIYKLFFKEVDFQISFVPYFTKSQSKILSAWKEKDLYYNYAPENSRKKVITLKKSQVLKFSL